MKPYIEVETQQVTAANGITYAYRRTGPQQGLPLVMCQHFRGNLDNWDPALVDALAVRREVITFDNVGVGATSGRTPHTVAQMAQDALEFLAALDITRADRARLLPRWLRRPGADVDAPRPGRPPGAGGHGTPGRARHARLGARRHGCDRNAEHRTGRAAAGVLPGQPVEPPVRDRVPQALHAARRGPRRPHDVGDPNCAVRRGRALGHTRPRTARTAQCAHAAGLRRGR